MSRWVWVFGLGLVACGGKGKATPASAVDVHSDDAPGGFVEIDLSEEEDGLDEIIGLELQQTTAECGDLITLEPAAMLGHLTDAQIRCLDTSVKDSERQTVKDKFSRVLLTDAWAKGDEHRWEGVARRHLEEIDRSDPDMCYKFAYYLSGSSADQMDEAIKWADVALDNRSLWEGDLHVKRVYSLFKIKTVAAQKKWTWQEEQYILDPSDDLFASKDASRNYMKTVAREWLEYARQSGKDEALPMQMCVSAAGSGAYCDDSH